VLAPPTIYVFRTRLKRKEFFRFFREAVEALARLVAARGTTAVALVFSVRRLRKAAHGA
jgi:hypothetical protein